MYSATAINLTSNMTMFTVDLSALSDAHVYCCCLGQIQMPHVHYYGCLLVHAECDDCKCLVQHVTSYIG